MNSKTLTRNQFAVYIAIVNGALTTGEAARCAGVVWHSANVAIQSLVRKGMVVGKTGTLAPTTIIGLGSVTFVQA